MFFPKRKRRNEFKPPVGPVLQYGPLKRAGSRRKGQLPPVRGPAARGRHDETISDRGDDEDVAAGGPSSGQWQTRQQRQEEAWVAFGVAARETYISRSKLRACCTSRQLQACQEEVQNQLNESWRQHICTSQERDILLMAEDAEAVGLIVVRTEAAEFISLEHRVEVKLPYWSCTRCLCQPFTADLTSLCLWPSSPVLPSFLYSERLMVHYKHAERGGLSMTGG
jgi:hypothetical protein